MDPIISIVGLSLIALGLAFYCYRTGQRDGAYEGYDFGWNDAKQFYDAKHADELACPCEIEEGQCFPITGGVVSCGCPCCCDDDWGGHAPECCCDLGDMIYGHPVICEIHGPVGRPDVPTPSRN